VNRFGFGRRRNERMTPRKSDLSDVELTRALVAGDIDAVNVLYVRYGRLAYSLAVRILGDPGAAEEVVQDAFVRLWKRASSFDAARGSLRTWLLTVVRNRAVDHLRGTTHERQELELLGDLRAEGQGSDPWREVSHSLERKAVRDAMGVLPSEQRQAVELAYFGGYSQQEISRMVDVPLGTVKSRTRLALEKLCSYLQGRGLIDGG
jgi:RNA polymerase sigma-70 factor, ECF subfamily